MCITLSCQRYVHLPCEFPSDILEEHRFQVYAVYGPRCVCTYAFRGVTNTLDMYRAREIFFPSLHTQSPVHASKQLPFPSLYFATIMQTFLLFSFSSPRSFDLFLLLLFLVHFLLRSRLKKGSFYRFECERRTDVNAERSLPRNASYSSGFCFVNLVFAGWEVGSISRRVWVRLCPQTGLQRGHAKLKVSEGWKSFSFAAQ